MIPTLFAAGTISSNRAAFSCATVTTKRDCDSANKAVVAEPVSSTSAPSCVPNTVSANATAKPPSATSCAD